jgi:hypothetical protein
MKRVELYGQVRRAVYVEGISRREAARRFGIDPRTVALCRIERRPPRLDLKIYPYLPQATVKTTSAQAYLSLLAGGAWS